MKLLGPVAFLLLLGGIWCQNNRNVRAGGKSSRKSGGNQGGDAGQSSSEADHSPRSTGGSGNNRGAGSSAESGREGAAGARAAGQQTDDMRLHFLKNAQVTCNDGTAAGWDVHARFLSTFFYWNSTLFSHIYCLHMIWEATGVGVSIHGYFVFTHSYLFVVLQVLPKGVQRKPPMAVISGRWVFKNPTA